MSKTKAIEAGNGIKSEQANWRFDQTVADVFDSHVALSVPFYEESHRISLELSDWFCPPGGRVLDIGCATGKFLHDLANRHQNKGISYVGIDSSEAMIQKSMERLTAPEMFELAKVEMMEYPFKHDEFSFIVSQYTLQFLPLLQRQEFCHRIYNSLAPRGAFILCEKVIDADSFFTDLFIQLHWDYKVKSGLECSEVYNKAASLRGILVPLSLDENITMLRDAGFERITTFYRWCNWAGIVATK